MDVELGLLLWQKNKVLWYLRTKSSFGPDGEELANEVWSTEVEPFIGSKVTILRH
jgi:hypothetical protein